MSGIHMSPSLEFTHSRKQKIQETNLLHNIRQHINLFIMENFIFLTKMLELLIFLLTNVIENKVKYLINFSNLSLSGFTQIFPSTDY